MATLAGHGIVSGSELSHHGPFASLEQMEQILKRRMELIHERVEGAAEEYHVRGDHVVAASILAFQTVSLEMSDIYIYIYLLIFMGIHYVYRAPNNQLPIPFSRTKVADVMVTHGSV